MSACAGFVGLAKTNDDYESIGEGVRVAGKDGKGESGGGCVAGQRKIDEMKVRSIERWRGKTRI